MKNSFEKIQDFDSRLPDMINDLLARREKSSGRVEESSFRRIPSIKAFKVITGEPNLFLEGTGLERKLPAEFKYIIWREQNAANRYMAFRIKALRKVLAKGRPDVFWRMVEHEMKHSLSFRVSAINSVLKGWYKNEDQNRIIRICIGVNNILKNEINELKYFRVEIPKGKPEEIIEFFKTTRGKPDRERWDRWVFQQPLEG
jgi:hypothetical protein